MVVNETTIRQSSKMRIISNKKHRPDLVQNNKSKPNMKEINN